MPTPTPTGRIVWHELLTPDPDAAIAFYKGVAGWGVIPFEGNPSYRIWTTGQRQDAGLMQLPDDLKQMGIPPHWLYYVGVPDADATMARATALGGQVRMPAQEIPNVGRFAVLADPQGAVFCILQPSMEGGEDVEQPAKPGQFSWHELATTDWQAGLNFYHDLFGWEKMDAMDMGPMGTYLLWGRKGMQLGGMFNKPPEMPAPPHWLCYIMVPNADAAAAKAAKLGGKVLNGPMDVPGGGRIAQLMDAQGAAIAVHSVAQVVRAERIPAAKPAAAARAARAKQTPKPAKPAARKPAKKAPAKKKPVKKSTAARARRRPVKKA
jgi:predicted enzyme related to lactoylglutathione lyase